MKISKRQLRRIIKEEKAKLMEQATEPLQRTHQGKVITPGSVAGKLFNLAAEIEALGEDFFSDSDSLTDWANDFVSKHNIMKGR